MKNIFIGLGIIFLLTVSIIQIRQIRKEGPLKPSKNALVLSSDGRLLTPPLSKPVPTGVDMKNCSSCKQHRDKY